MKILVIGRGGREHAIICALKKSPKVEKIYCAPGNGGISCDAINVPINEMDKEKMKSFAKNEKLLSERRGRNRKDLDCHENGKCNRSTHR